MTASGNVLEVRGLTTRFFTQRGVVGAVEDISLDVGRGEAVGAKPVAQQREVALDLPLSFRHEA